MWPLVVPSLEDVAQPGDAIQLRRTRHANRGWRLFVRLTAPHIVVCVPVAHGACKAVIFHHGDVMVPACIGNASYLIFGPR